MHITRPIIVITCLILAGCSMNKAAYTTVGAAAGAGVGYSYHKDVKEAVIGGAAGGALGFTVGSIQDHFENKKYKSGYDKGYNQAQVDIAIQNWEENTGKCAYIKKKECKHLTQFRVPERKQDDVAYESHYVTLEDYR